MQTAQSQDTDDDGLIDSNGQPDQTFDAWSVTGASAYTGGLHLAALKCSSEIAKLMGDVEASQSYEATLAKAKESYEKKLWNGKYYNYDSGKNYQSDSIMADMCCGHWTLRSSGFNYEVRQ